MKEIDARALACPGPVIELRRSIEGGEGAIRVLVADELARSNVTRFAESRGCAARSEALPEGGFGVTVERGEAPGSDAAGRSSEGACELAEGEIARHGTAPLVVQVSAATMGSGNDELGALLLRSFLKTQIQLERPPDTIVFYNGGVALCCEGSPLLDDLARLAEKGTEILACGTCLNFFALADRLRVGRVTDMLEISTRLAGAGRVVRP